MTDLIFDLDGTLWDSREILAKSWNRAIKEVTDYDIEIKSADLTPLFGKPLEVIFDSIFPLIKGEELERLSKRCVLNHNEDVRKGECILYDGMVEGIKSLSKKHRLFIVSNCLSGYIEGFLYASKLEEYFCDFTCPGDTGLSKAENIRLIIERNKVEKAVYIGDTATDSASARDAKIPFVFCDYGLGKTDDYDKKIDNFLQLLDIDFENI